MPIPTAWSRFAEALRHVPAEWQRRCPTITAAHAAVAAELIEEALAEWADAAATRDDDDADEAPTP